MSFNSTKLGQYLKSKGINESAYFFLEGYRKFFQPLTKDYLNAFPNEFWNSMNDLFDFSTPEQSTSTIIRIRDKINRLYAFLHEYPELYRDTPTEMLRCFREAINSYPVDGYVVQKINHLARFGGTQGSKKKIVLLKHLIINLFTFNKSFTYLLIYIFTYSINFFSQFLR